MISRTRLAVVAFLCALLIACTGAQVLQSITVGLDVLATVSPILASANVAPAVTAEVSEYSQEAALAWQQCSALLSQPGSAVQISTQCAAIVGKAVAPSLPTGTPQTVANLVAQISMALQKTLDTLPVPMPSGALKPAVSTAGSSWAPSKKETAAFAVAAERAAKYIKAGK